MFVMAAVTGMSVMPPMNRLWSYDCRGTGGIVIRVVFNVMWGGGVARRLRRRRARLDFCSRSWRGYVVRGDLLRMVPSLMFRFLTGIRRHRPTSDRLAYVITGEVRQPAELHRLPQP